MTEPQPRRSPHVTAMAEAARAAPDIEKLKRALERGDVAEAIRLALGGR